MHAVKVFACMHIYWSEKCFEYKPQGKMKHTFHTENMLYMGHKDLGIITRKLFLWSHGTKLKNSREALSISEGLQIFHGGVRIECAEHQKSFPTSVIV
jgi:hypothetical protein